MDGNKSKAKHSLDGSHVLPVEEPLPPANKEVAEKKKPYESPQVRALGEIAKVTLKGSPPPLVF